jgi:hypothetical protein
MTELNELYAAKYSPEVMVNGGVDENGHAIKKLQKPFLIPIYQRLYTWEVEHVERLMKDLLAAFDENRAAEYFIGAIVVISDKEDLPLELIDGQQRMTTLWLLASVLLTYEISEGVEWQKFISVGEGDARIPRLKFSGRKSDEKALQEVINSGMKTIDENTWIKNEKILSAFKTIKAFLKSNRFKDVFHIQEFSRYIWKNATFVVTHLHPKTKKERLFDTMNSAGVQLEKHEILKALLLHKLAVEDRPVYAKAWDLCADIHGYFPNSVQSGMQYGLKKLKHEDIHQLYQQIQKPGAIDGGNDAVDTGETKELCLSEIIADSSLASKAGEIKGKKPELFKNVVNFPVFLLHVLRIFINDTEGKISLDDKKLIEIFKLYFSNANDSAHIIKPYENPEQCMEFIRCLLECRLLLDNFVIKGKKLEAKSEYTSWQIASSLGSLNGSRLKREDTVWRSITMLQSMMYFSRDITHVPWLTKTLRGLHELQGSWDGIDGAIFFKNLKVQDLQYAIRKIDGEGLRNIVGAVPDTSGLGLKTPRYWFYKLEYCLWEIWFNKHEYSAGLVEIPKFIKDYKIDFHLRHVTSIEHVSPQSQNNGAIPAKLLDRFGNLALITDSENSTNSDKDPEDKSDIFKAKLRKGQIQSLKLGHIFEYIINTKVWDKAALEKHETAMIEVLKAFHPGLMEVSANSGEQ